MYGIRNTNSFLNFNYDIDIYKKILKEISNGVIVVNKNDRIVTINPIAKKVTGYNEEKGLLFSNIFKIYNNSTKEKIIYSIPKILENNNPIVFKEPVLLLSNIGKFLKILLKFIPFKNLVVVIFNNITEQINIQEEINEKINKEREKIEKLSSIEFVSRGIVHDLNNILGSIYGSISIIKEYIQKEVINKEKIYKYISLAEKSIETAKDLTNQLLNFLKEGKIKYKSFDFKSVIEEIVLFNLRGREITYKINSDENLYDIKGDKLKLAQVFSNLTINAIQSMKEKGHIYIEIKNVNNPTPDLLGKYIKIIFKDEGHGISQEIQNKIFSPYFTTKKDGSGLGLSIVKSIIEKHKGKILVESEINKGTKFIIYLPAIHRKETKQSNYKSINSREKNNINVLIMDDNQEIKNTLKEMLNILGYNAVLVSNGEEAIKEYQYFLKKKEPFDLVILDLVIPGGMGGLETIKKLLNIDKNIKAIISSGSYEHDVMKNYKKYGFKGRLKKPFLLSDLKSEILKVLSED